jgi:probable F420-dependent oxidoreductase
VAFAKQVEDRGFDTLLISDHFGARMAIAPALVLAAQATQRLRVGSFVYDNDFRHPAILAQEAATIDILTDGRFDFGIGAGWLKSEYDAAGIPFDGGKARVERLAEALTIIKQLWTELPVTFSGQHYRVRELTGSFKPVQQPHPPIVIGGGGPRLLGLAAREADIISIMPRSRADGGGLEDSDASAEAFDQKVAVIKDAAGDRFPALELNTLVQAVVITDDRRQAGEGMVKDWALPADRLLESPLLLIGQVDELVEMVHRRREQFGISYTTVFERDMAKLAPVIDRL